mmetsp:Transcript_31492/g.82283  ORF Transcript_31492/g.82283 Transcript_31492/m.82283 type:complete len:256 (+) Transcript_31492:33-800(+)
MTFLLLPALPFLALHRLGGPPTGRGSQPFIIGVAGATASGKSSVVREIVRLLDHDDVCSITQDCFYRNLNEAEHRLADEQNYNFDHPRAFDFEHQHNVLSQLRSGSADVSIPSYDFVTHSRLGPEHDQHVCSPEVVIFEGILALFDDSMRDIFDLKIFVDVDADTRLSRRIRRDMEERGRSLDGVLQQYERFVKPATEQFVVPTKRYADIILPRGVDNTVGVDIIAQHINGVLMQRELLSETLLQAHNGEAVTVE